MSKLTENHPSKFENTYAFFLKIFMAKPTVFKMAEIDKFLKCRKIMTYSVHLFN